MKQLKTIELTGYKPIDSKLVAGYGLFDRVELDSSASPDSILTDLYNLENTDLKLAKSILCKRFHYRELRFSEGVFITIGTNPPLILTAESEKQEHVFERGLLDTYLYHKDGRKDSEYKNYFRMLYLEVNTKQVDFWEKFSTLLIKFNIITAIMIFSSYPLIGNNIIIVMLIITYATINLVRNMRTLTEMELEDFKSYYE